MRYINRSTVLWKFNLLSVLKGIAKQILILVYNSACILDYLVLVFVSFLCKQTRSNRRSYGYIEVCCFVCVYAFTFNFPTFSVFTFKICTLIRIYRRKDTFLCLFSWSVDLTMDLSKSLNIFYVINSCKLFILFHYFKYSRGILVCLWN